jgi:hypothetical protein
MDELVKSLVVFFEKDHSYKHGNLAKWEQNNCDWFSTKVAAIFWNPQYQILICQDNCPCLT